MSALVSLFVYGHLANKAKRGHSVKTVNGYALRYQYHPVLHVGLAAGRLPNALSKIYHASPNGNATVIPISDGHDYAKKQLSRSFSRSPIYKWVGQNLRITVFTISFA